MNVRTWRHPERLLLAEIEGHLNYEVEQPAHVVCRVLETILAMAGLFATSLSAIMSSCAFVATEVGSSERGCLKLIRKLG